MRVLFFDILTDSSEVREDDNRRFEDVGGYKGAVTTMLSRHAHVEYIDAGMCALDVIQNIKRELWRYDFDGIFMGGSACNIHKQELIMPWHIESFKLLEHAHRIGMPVLGCCGAHQFGTHAFGGSVVQNPKGRNFGTSALFLTREGRHHPLFAGITNHTLFQ